MQKWNPMEVKFEGLEMQKWNIPMDRAQKVDEKNGVICRVIIITPSLLVVEMSKMANFLSSEK